MPTTEEIKTQFEQCLAEEMDGWMFNFVTPLAYVMKRIVNGDVDETIRPYSDEQEPFIKRLAQEFIEEDPRHSEVNQDEGIATAIHAAQALASGDPGRIEEQLMVYLSEAQKEGKYLALTYEHIADTYKGDFVRAAKAIANALAIFGNRQLPYPHS